MGTAYDWSTTASSNGAADATINFAEGQAPSTVNDAARALMARVKAWLTQQGGVSSGGSSNAYTYTSPSGHAFSALTTNSRISFKANHSNTGAATLAVDGLTATAIRKNNGATALVTGDIISGQIYDVVYDGTYWVLLGVSSVGVYQPLDADLTAIAALGYTSGEYIIKKTAADTWALITITTAGAALLDDADAAAQLTTLGVSAFAQTILDDADAAAVRTTIGLGTMATQASTSYAALAGATFTGDVNFGGGSDAMVLSSGGYMTLKDSGGTARGYMGFGIDGSVPANGIILRGESGILLSYGGGGGLSLTAASTALLNGKAMLAHAGSYTSGQVTVQSGGSPSGGSDGDIVLIY